MSCIIRRLEGLDTQNRSALYNITHKPLLALHVRRLRLGPSLGDRRRRFEQQQFQTIHSPTL